MLTNIDTDCDGILDGVYVDYPSIISGINQFSLTEDKAPLLSNKLTISDIDSIALCLEK